ncbi:hypothetical protein AGMMS50229_17060 [Campylobacterota bacterium]|nr:hypothetical protein AGMMS50229_17060 [Campylobacterota bacterium]
MDFSKNLNFLRWFDLLIVLSFVVCTYSLLLPVRILTNGIIGLLSFSVMFIAMGSKAIVERGAGYRGEAYFTVSIGIIFLVVGLVLLLRGSFFPISDFW